MADSLRDFARRIEALAEKADMAASEKAVAVAKAVLRDFLNVTAVDTSAAVSNWQIGLGAAKGSFIPAYYPGRRGSTAELSESEAYDEGARVLAFKRPGQDIHITNNTPYIDEIEDRMPGTFTARAEFLARKLAQREG